MITRIEIDGFKSLSNFELNLKPGLNILVGPNGVGKTNIVLFFEFLSKVITNKIGYAVSSIGGAGAIFKKTGSNTYQNDISFKVYGSIRINKSKSLTYEYKCVVNSSFEKDSIYFSAQNLRFRSGTKFWLDPKEKRYSSTKWDLEFEVRNEENLNKEILVKSINEKKISGIRHLPHGIEGASVKDNFIEFIRHSNSVQNSIAKPILLFVHEYGHLIYQDLIGGETFNVEPTKVKGLEDAATPPGIKKDGSGLSTTLYAMKKSKPKTENRSRYFYHLNYNEKTYDPKTLQKIVKYLKLANSTIEDLDVENDPFDNKLIIKIFIKVDGDDAVLPLSFMSDGTIKWLALITAILTSKTIFSIEEPENFLHPWMQAEIANIMREHLESKQHESFVLMTTHSESLLNSSQPEEIIIVDMENGKTIAKRISDIKLIKEEISNSGFGLGHFYFLNSIQDV